MNYKKSLSTLVSIFTLFVATHAQYPGKNEYKELLNGAVDMHIHSAPDAFDRSLNDIDLARLAKKEGFRAVVIKNHVSSTAGRAELVNSEVSGIRVYGGIALNRAVGGINPEAVSWMTRMSPEYGKMVWFPTFDAAHHKKQYEQEGDGITILAKGKLKPEVLEVLKIIKDNDLILATGHLSPGEVKELVDKAREMDIQKIMVTHAIADTPEMGMQQMKELAAQGAFIELTYLSYLSGPQAPLAFLQASKHVSIEQMKQVIKELGAEHVIISTDLGQSGNAIAPDGLKNFVKLLIAAGISEQEIATMIKQNPYKLLGL